MRGWTSNFTPYEPVAPAAVRALPRDFDPRGHDDFLTAPRAAELAECDRCDWRLCNRLIRAAGRTVKPDCAAFLVMDGRETRRPRLQIGPSAIRARILAALAQAAAPLTLAEIMAATELCYDTARKHTLALVKTGAVLRAGVRGSGKAGGQEKLYTLGGTHD